VAQKLITHSVVAHADGDAVALADAVLLASHAARPADDPEVLGVGGRSPS
jgi:hypothetical protein